MWLVAGAAVVLGGLAVVAATLAEPDTRPVPTSTGPVTPRELRSVRFPIVWRGYDPGHVDALLARAAAALEDAQRYGGRPEDGALPAFLARTFEDEPPPEDDEPSGEELEDAGGDGPGGLDR